MPSSGPRLLRSVLSVARSAWLRRAVLACALIALGLTAATRRGEISAALRSAGAPGIGAAIVAVAAGVLAQWRAWHRSLLGLGVRASSMTTLTIFLLSLPGKYLPGGVWTTMLQVEHGARADIDRSRSLGASLVSMLATVLVGALIGIGFLLDATDEIPRSGLLALALVPGLVLLLPAVQLRLTGWLQRVSGRESRPISLPGRDTLAMIGWNVVGWVLLGAHVTVLTGGDISLPSATSAFALSWTLGFLFIVAPAGAGIRDAVLAVAVGTSVDGTGVAVALLSRAVVTLVDLALAGVALGLTFRAARSGDRSAATTAGPR